MLSLVVSLAWYRHAPRHVPKGQPPLADLSKTGLDAFKAAFNEASDRHRLLVLLSPT